MFWTQTLALPYTLPCILGGHDLGFLVPCSIWSFPTSLPALPQFACFWAHLFFLKLYSTLCAHSSGKANWSKILLIVFGSGTKNDRTGLLSLEKGRSAWKFLGFELLVAIWFPKLWSQLPIWLLGGEFQKLQQSFGVSCCKSFGKDFTAYIIIITVC